MTSLPLNEVFKLAPGPVPALMFARLLLAVGLPMAGFTLAGQPLAAVATGADAGPRFAIVVALTGALALFAASHLGVTRAYWATLTVILVMRREGMVSLKLTLQYLAGTLLGMALNPALGGALAVAGTLLAGSWHRRALRRTRGA